MKNGITLFVPAPTNLGNSHDHHMVRHRKKIEYWELLSNLVLAKKNPRPPATPPQYATVAITYFYAKKPMDRDNLFARLKFILDWMKHQQLRGVGWGYIYDDSDKYIDLKMPVQVQDTQKAGNFVITISW